MKKLEEVFKDIYNESLQKLKEFNKNNILSNIKRGISGRAYADRFINLKKSNAPTDLIKLDGTLKKSAYSTNMNKESYYIDGSNQLTSNANFNTFLIETLYEETLLEGGEEMESDIKDFFIGFCDRIEEANINISFDELNLLDYNSVLELAA